MSKAYRDSQDQIKIDRINELLKELPTYVEDFVGSMLKRNRKPQTLLTYVQRISVFFDYLSVNPRSPLYKKNRLEMNLEALNSLTVDDIDRFLANVGNSAATTNNYLSALNALFEYLYNRDKISHNVITKVERASNKKYEHQVIRLTDAQAKGFIDSATSGTGLTKKQAAAYRKNAYRDRAICFTLIRTGLRVSELVSLDVGDINFEESCFSVIRKGNKPDTVFFDDDVREAITEYLDTRPSLSSKLSSEPLFISTWGKTDGERITVRQVEHLVKKYSSAGALGTGLGISPHKLRATFATAMLNETGNIVLVQAQLSHENIQTTSIYIDKSTQDKKNARNLLKERSERDNEETGSIYNRDLGRKR